MQCVKIRLETSKIYYLSFSTMIHLDRLIKFVHFSSNPVFMSVTVSSTSSQEAKLSIVWILSAALPDKHATAAIRTCEKHSN